MVRILEEDELSLVEKFRKMISLGLWPMNMSKPDPQLLERIHRLNEEIEKRVLELYLPEDDTHLLEQVKSQYHVDMKQKKQEKETKSEGKQEKDWDKFKAENFVHLGQHVSSWLNDRESNRTKLKLHEIPLIKDAKDLVDLLGKDIGKIKWYAYHRKSSKINHYIEFQVPKTTGGYREIAKPKIELNQIQEKIKTDILDKISFPEYVFGFVKNRSIYDNAREHRNSKLIINIDILNFFHNINFRHVRNAFVDLGYSGEIATVLALLTTKQPTREVEIDGNTIFVFQDTRYLPQGACTSPGVANLVAQKFDYQLNTRSKSLGFKYTRYADDLTFSTSDEESKINELLYMARKTLELHGFKANPNKTKVLGKGDRQEVTGLIMNSGQPKVPRKWRRRLRAGVHQFQFIEDREIKAYEYIRLMGCIQFLRFSHPGTAKEYEDQLNRQFKPPE